MCAYASSPLHTKPASASAEKPSDGNFLSAVARRRLVFDSTTSFLPAAASAS